MMRGKWLGGWLCLILGLTVPDTAGAQSGWKVLYDGEIKVKVPIATPAERNILRRAAVGQSPHLKCGGSPQLLGRAPGPFLKRGAVETALVYSCNEAVRLLVLRSGQPVLHAALWPEEEWANPEEVYSVQDVNRDGLRELAVVGWSGIQAHGVLERWMNLWDFAAVAGGGVPRLQQQFMVDKGDCLVDDPQQRGTQRAYRLLVRPVPEPVYRADEFGADDCRPDVPLRLLRRGVAPVLTQSSVSLLSPTRLPLP